MMNNKYFSKWKDESCANYVGYLLKLRKSNVIVSRENPTKPGRYDITESPLNIDSGSDPSGEHPDWYKRMGRNLTLKEIKKIVKQYERDEKSNL